VGRFVNIIRLFVTVMSIGLPAGCLTLSTTDEGPLSSSGGSGSDKCASVQDCPTVTICSTMKCIDGSCVSDFVPAGLQCNDTNVCDGAGSCVSCVTDSDCKGSNPTCVNNACISCNDGIKNGSETSVDCGGSKCDPCPAGTPCSSNNDCDENLDCVDGVCCESACTTACKSCNQTGKVGICEALPKGTEDPGICDMTKACGGAGFGCLLKDGQPCMQNSQCLGGSCFSGICF
jgi:hypothetical protein